MELIFEVLLWGVYLFSLYFSVFWLLVFLTKNTEREKQKIKEFPLVSILVPAYNEQDSIKKTLKSLVGLEYPKDKIEIIVLNDGSKDKTSRKVKEFISENKGNNIRLIEKENTGKADSLNLGISICKGEYFACLDADSFVEKEALKEMIAHFQSSDKDLKVVTPMMHVYQPKSFLQKLQSVEYTVSIFLARLMGRINCIYVAPGPFSLYKKKAVLSVGGFDKTSITEDQEIGYRLQKKHYKLEQCYHAHVHTITPSTFYTLYRQRNRWFKGSLMNIFKYKKMMLNKNYGDFGLMQIPMNLFTFIFALAGFFFFIYLSILPLSKSIKNFLLIGFDPKPYLLQPFNAGMNFIDWFEGKIVLFVAALLVSSMIIYFSYKNVGSRIKPRRMFYIFPYFFIYYIILSFIAFIVMLEIIIGKKQKW